MKIAIPITEEKVSMHFGRIEQFALFDIDEEQNKILLNKRVNPPSHGQGVFPRWLYEQGVNIVITGGMGPRAKNIFAQNNIQVFVGAPSVTPEEAVQQYLDGLLQVGENACEHD